MGEQIPEITPEAIAKVLGLDSVEVVEKELILLASKRIERIKLRKNQSEFTEEIFIKYGYDPGLFSEIFFYNELAEPVKNNIPKVLACETNSNLMVLVIEWINGTNPDYSNEEVVKRVFKDLGKWAAKMGNGLSRVDRNKIDIVLRENYRVTKQLNKQINKIFINNTFINVFYEMSALREKQTILMDIGGIELIKFVQSLDDDLIQQINNKICSVPATLHPGDVSKYNTLIRQSNGDVIFIDFENMKIGPMSLLMEYIGEEDIHVPLGNLAETALRHYVDGWNKYSSYPVTWNQFHQSYLASRVMYKCFLLNWYFKKLESQSSRIPDEQWAKTHAGDLLKIFKEYKEQT